MLYTKKYANDHRRTFNYLQFRCGCRYEFFKNVLQFPHVDAGRGWLIFGLPPSEVAIHPADKGGRYELYLLCDDIDAFIEQMADQKIVCSAAQVQRWGSVIYLTLPGGGKLGVYEPKHARP